MGQNDKKRVSIYGAIAVFVLAGSFGIMPPLLAAEPAAAEMQTVRGNTAISFETGGQEKNPNAISKDRAVVCAMKALKAQGFDLEEFEKQPTEIRYVGETVPAGDPVWAVVFRADKSGYAYLFGDAVTAESRKKLAAVGAVEDCIDKDGTPGIRAWYSYTQYTLVEINALRGAYIRHGECIVSFGKTLQIEKAHWAQTTEEAWAAKQKN